MNTVSLICMVVLGRCEEGSITEVTNNDTQLQRNILPNINEEPDDHIDHEHDDHAGHDHEQLPDNPAHDYRTWLAASGSILLISLCGIFGVLVIPIMQKVFYQHLLQFLISLAVGTLAGDALLHLLPHALLPEDHGQHDHDRVLHTRAVWLGFVATVSMIGFFFFEKVINVLGEMKARNKQKQLPGEQEKKVKVVREGHVASDRVIGGPQCKSKYSTHCINDFDLAGGDVAPGDCEEKRELKPQLVEEGEHDTVIISEHEVLHLHHWCAPLQCTRVPQTWKHW